MPNPPEHVCLLGASLGTGNRGVSALGASLVHLMRQVLPGAEPVMLIGSRDPGPYEALAGDRRIPVRIVNHRMSPKAPPRQQLILITFLAVLYRLLPVGFVRRAICGLNPWIRSVATARIAGEICGGDSFSDIYGFQRFFYRSLPTILVILIRGEVVLFPQTYGPFKGRMARSIAAWIVRHASTALARDQVSAGVARELGGRPERVRFCPDVAFTLPVERPAQPAIEPPLPAERPDCLIGFNVSGLLYHGGYSRSNMFGLKLEYREFVRLLIPVLLEHPGHRVLLVPHTFAPPDRVESDNGASAELRASLPPELQSRVHLVTEAYDQHRIKGVIGMCDFFLGSRMHACIGALSQGIPTVGVAYSRKFAGVFESVDMADWVVDGKTVAAAPAVERIRQLLADRQIHRDRLAAGVARARGQVLAAFTAIAQGSGPAPHPAPDATASASPARAARA